jgi:uncharacterized protein YqjF (DUF2071 family)
MKFTMTGSLNRCLLLTYRCRPERVRHLLPSGLHLVTFRGWAFWNVVLCEVEKMRPDGPLHLIEITYKHIAYRLYVRTHGMPGAELDGLCFVRSDVDNALIANFGDRLTDFRFHLADISFEADGGLKAQVKTRDRKADATFAWKESNAFQLSPRSPFKTVEEARSFLKHRPLGLSMSEDGETLRVASVERDELRWRETPLNIEHAQFDFLEPYDCKAELASAVAPLDYRWDLGETRHSHAHSKHRLTECIDELAA